MKDYNVFIGESLTPQLVEQFTFILAQPTSGKTTYASSSKHNHYIIDLDDILHVIKKMYGMSGWDMLNTICFDCQFDEDVKTLMESSDEIQDKVMTFVELLVQTIKACVAVGTEGNNITVLAHHHSLLTWSFLAYLRVEAELKGFHPEINLYCFQRKTSDIYITEWKKRQSTENSKNRHFSDDELAEVYFTWCHQSDLVNFVKQMELKADAIHYELLDEGEYLSTFFNVDPVSDIDIWDRDNDIHRYQVMALWNLMQQKAMSQLLCHDVDKYGYHNLDDWLENGFPKHKAQDTSTTSCHHKENISRIYMFPEMLCDWMSACRRRSDRPWKYDNWPLHLSSYPYDIIAMMRNAVDDMSEDAWSCIWLLSKLIHHNEFDNFYHSDEFSEFPVKDMYKFMTR